jgi:taurine dioxygenase
VPEYQVRFRCKTHSVAIRDNRSTQHYAAQDFWPTVRNLERAGIIGDRPY